MSVRFRVVPEAQHKPGEPTDRNDQDVPAQPERRGKGRPAIGGPIRQELGHDLKALVETWALGNGTNRAAAVRILLRRAVEQELHPTARTVLVDSDELRILLARLQVGDVRRARFALDTGLTVQINNGPWTAPLGHLDFSAQHQEED